LARASQAAFFSFDIEEETDPELADLWLLLMACNPEGTWHARPNPARRPLDDTRDR
jgi:hypothetical protein